MFYNHETHIKHTKHMREEKFNIKESVVFL